jgi:purine-binding chemotaxis protein CheW
MGLVDMESGLSLFCRVDARLCALPLESIVETTRPLPCETLAGTPAFVLGLSVIRGAPVPVVDAGRLLSGRRSSPSRFVVLRIGERRIALAVEAVVGVRSMNRSALQDLPPLVRTADADAITAVGALDAELLLVLTAARIIPDDLLVSMDGEALAS